MLISPPTCFTFCARSHSAGYAKWPQHHPEFSAAVGVAKAKCAAWWEKQGRHLAVNGGGNATLVVFGLKNMSPDGWRERQEVQHDASDSFAQALAEISRCGSAVPVASQRRHDDEG